MVKYELYLDEGKCGPTVLPSLRSSLKSVLNEAVFITLEKKVFTQRRKPLKEAVPFTIELVKAMEIFVVESAFEAAKVYLWWVLCMIFASLRFVHVKPLELEIAGGHPGRHLRGLVADEDGEEKEGHQVLGARRCGFSDKPWLTSGIDGFRKLFPGKDAPGFQI